ncbi:MAG: hypothetical protein ACOC3X_03755 [Nanoarchaeota archaeon]
MNNLELKIKDQIINYVNKEENLGIEIYKAIKKKDSFIANFIVESAKYNSGRYLSNFLNDDYDLLKSEKSDKIFYKEIFNSMNIFYYLLQNDLKNDFQINNKDDEKTSDKFEEFSINNDDISLKEFLEVRKVAFDDYCNKLSYIKLKDKKNSDLIFKLSENATNNYIKKNYNQYHHKNEEFNRLEKLKEDMLYEDVFFSLINMYSLLKDIDNDIEKIKKETH